MNTFMLMNKFLTYIQHFFAWWQSHGIPASNTMAMYLETPTANMPPAASTPAPSEAAANLPPTPPEPPESTTASTPPSPHTPLTPLNWLAKQAPEDTIFIYIDPASHQMLELRSQPRQQLAKVFNIPMYRDPAAQWESAGANCLMRVALAPALERAKFEKTVEKLLCLQSARLYLSTELARLDQVIAHLHTKITQKSKGPCQAGQAGHSLPHLPAAVWFGALLHANERVPNADDWQLLGSFLRQRQETSAEMAKVDKVFLPALTSLGVDDDK